MPQISKNYVGVSGVASVEEAKEVVRLAKKAGFSVKSGHILMIGLQASYNSLNYGLSAGNMRVPHLDMLSPILSTAKGDAFTTIHYYTKWPERLVDELAVLLRHNGIYEAGLLGGVQINGVWPTKHQILEINNMFPHIKIILQMSKMVTGGLTDAQVAEKLAGEYENVDYILLDSSYGRGIEFDQEGVASMYKTLRDGGVRSGIVIAGGLTGANVGEKARWLREALRSTDFSIDSESGLRDRLGEGYGNDVLNLEKVKRYLDESANVFLKRNEATRSSLGE